MEAPAGNCGINFPDTEIKHFELEWLFFEEHLQRSLEVPLLPAIPTDEDDFKGNINLQTNFLVENPKNNPSNNLNFFSQPKQDQWINPQIQDQILEADFHLWNSICTEFEDAWKPINSQVNPNTNPFLVDDVILINHNRNHNNNNIDDFNFFNDETLNAVVEEGLKKSLKEEGSVISESEVGLIKSNENNSDANNKQKTSKMDMLKYEEIRKYFDMPISKAAKELKVGLTVLKKRCRELNIKRWPHRKIKSLKSLISNVKELGMAEVAEALEEHRKKLQVLPEMELTAETKRLRQACFKANYKKRRALALLA